jgi:hypothetical protein
MIPQLTSGVVLAKIPTRETTYLPIERRVEGPVAQEEVGEGPGQKLGLSLLRFAGDVMAYSRLGLDFVDMSNAGLPGPPHVHIYVKVTTTDERGLPFITADCVCMAELDEQIARLHRELNDIREEARKKFTSPKRRRQSPS